MSRFTFVLCLCSLLLYTVGCQVYRLPNDFRVPAFVERHNDYRGFDPDCRSGSVLVGKHGMHQVTDVYHNVGDFGITTPVTVARRSTAPRAFETPPITLPQRPSRGEITIDPRPIDHGGFTPDRHVPSPQELLDRQRNVTPGISPIIPAIPGVAPLPVEEIPRDTVPFSPSDEILTPPSTFPTFTDEDPPITLEELRRLDPSVRDLQIISIEDASVGVPIR